jgi:hypothetical protein
MWNKFISTKKYVIVLDTNVARNLFEEKDPPEWYTIFLRMQQDGICFSLANLASTELENQLQRLSVDGYKRGIDRLRNLLSREFPVSPKTEDILNSIFNQDDTDLMSAIQAKSHGAWGKLCASEDFVHSLMIPYYSTEENQSDANDSLIGLENSLDAITQARDFADELFFIDKLLFDDHSSEDDLQRIRDGWIEIFKFDHIEPNYFRNKFDALVKFISYKIDEKISPPILLSSSLKIPIYILSEYIARNNQRKDSYNPHSRKKFNDGIDYFISFELIAPVILCTYDRGLREAVKKIMPTKTNIICSPEQISNEWTKINRGLR